MGLNNFSGVPRTRLTELPVQISGGAQQSDRNIPQTFVGVLFLWWEERHFCLYFAHVQLCTDRFRRCSLVFPVSVHKTFLSSLANGRIDAFFQLFLSSLEALQAKALGEDRSSN